MACPWVPWANAFARAHRPTARAGFCLPMPRARLNVTKHARQDLTLSCVTDRLPTKM